MATVQSLADRLRTEIGDIGRPFTQSFTATADQTRFQLNYKPIQGSTLVVKVNDVDVSQDCSVDEVTGLIILDTAAQEDDTVFVVGTVFRYFTDYEMQGYIQTAFAQHSLNSTDSNGRRINLSSLPAVEEYPLVILASTQALYTLATDAAFDIDIYAPDGVNIPRSERYRQLTDMIATRHAQYQELGEKLGIGMYKIEVFNLRRISRLTNRYVPIYRPLEIGDLSLPERLYYPVPTYGGVITPSVTATCDLAVYQGDSYSVDIDFPFDITNYDLKAQIRPQKNSPVLLANFTIVKTDAVAGKATLSLTRDVTENLPTRSYWDIQLTTPSDPTYRKTHVSGLVICEREVTQQ